MMNKLTVVLVLLLILPANKTFAQSGGVLATIDVSGKRGSDGNNGSSYSTSPGGSGRNGGDAGEPDPGQHSGDIDVNLASNNTGTLNGVLIVTGKMKAAGGGVFAPVKYDINYGLRSYLYLVAKGGGGGDGGTGGNGEGGRNGSDGMNASRYSSGTSGGNGGTGGNAGDGTSGAPGGKGGKVTIHVNSNETGLLMLAKWDITGGNGGDAGRNGSAGSGGRGGRGGSSYSWTDTEYYTDSEGKQQSRTTFHSNPGGSDGWSGSSGNSSSKSLRAGTRGDDGNIEYVVTNPDGSKTFYDSMYSLQLESFDFDERDHNGIFEPGEKVVVSNIKIKNNGSMPTPTHQPIKIFIKNEEWVITDGSSYEVPKSLEPGEEYVVPQAFEFKIKDTTIVTDGPRFSMTETIEPLAEVTQADRIFDEFNYNRAFEITFPVEITPIKTLTSMAAGEKSQIFWKVKNISTQPLGMNSEFGRQILSGLTRIGGDANPDQLKFYDTSGKQIDLVTGMQTEVQILKPGEETIIEGSIQLGQESIPYTSTDIRSSLYLDTISGIKANPTQHQKTTIRVAQTYHVSPKPGILLVTNHGTTEAELTAWKKNAEMLKISLDVWDLSYNGKLKFTEALKNGSTLAKDFKGKTIILLNNEFDGAGQQVRAEELVARKEFLQAVGEDGTSFVVLGGSSGARSILENYLVPTFNDPVEQKGLKGFLNNFKQLMKEQKNQFAQTFDKFEVGDSYLFGKPKETQLRKKSEKLYNKLRQLAPEQRSYVVYTYNPRRSGKALFGLIKKWTLGEVEVRRGVSSSIGLGMSVDMADAVLHNPDTILGAEVKLATMMGLPVETKMEILQNVLDSSDYAAQLAEQGLDEALVKSIVGEIAVEQSPFRTEGSGSRQTLRAMKLLSAMTQIKPNVSVDPKGAAGKIVNQIAAELHVMTDSQWRWWDALAPWGSKIRTARAIRGAAYDWLDLVYPTREAQKTAGYFISDARKVLKTELKADGSLAAGARKRFFYPTEGNGLRYAPNADAGTDVMTAEKFSQLLASEQSRFDNTAEFEKLMHAERCSLSMEN